MATVNLTKDNFAEVVNGNETVLVDFWAEWCGPCKQFGPIFETSSENHSDIVYAKVDTEAEPELAGSFGIQSIPTLMVFKEQTIVFAQPGALPGEVLEDLVGQVKALDMDEVRKALEEEEAADHSHDHDHAGHEHSH